MYLAGGSLVARYDGTSWTPQQLPDFNFISLWGSGSNDVFTGGTLGALFHYDGLGWSQVKTDLTENITSIVGVGKSVYLGSRTPSSGPPTNPTIARLQRDVAW